MPKEVSFAAIYLYEPQTLNSYIKYLKNTNSSYSDKNKQLANELDEVINDLKDKGFSKPLDHPVRGAELREYIEDYPIFDELNGWYDDHSWRRFTDFKRKQKKKKAIALELKAYNKLISSREKKKRTISESVNNISDDDIKDTREVMQNAYESLKNEYPGMPISESDFIRIFSLFFTEVSLGDSSLGIDFGPNKDDKASIWISKMAKLFSSIDSKK